MNEWLPVLVVFFSVMIVAGPIFLMQPSKRQKSEMQLRTRAAQMGLRVRLESVPEKTEAAKQQRTIALYSLPWQYDKADTRPWLLIRGTYAHELNFHEEWQWSGTLIADAAWHHVLRSQLSSLPASVIAVANGPQGVSLYWREVGGSETLLQLHQWLARLAQGRQAS